MKRDSLVMLLALVLAHSFFSCSNDRRSKVNNLAVIEDDKSKKADGLSGKPRPLFVKNDSICIIADKKTFCIKRDTTINYKNSYSGIYEIIGDSVKKSYSLAVNNLIYFTTYEYGIGHTGYLYVFDAIKKNLVKEPDFNHNYLFSSWGIFIIDRGTNKIFTINPALDDQKTMPVIAASMYSVNGNNFKFYKIIYDRSNNIEEDTTIIKIFRRSLADNGKKGLLFPKDSWK